MSQLVMKMNIRCLWSLLKKLINLTYFVLYWYNTFSAMPILEQIALLLSAIFYRE